MNDTQKMFQIIINGQSSFRQEVLGKIDKLDKKLDGVEERLERKIDSAEKNLTIRIGKLGKQLAYLEDDTPTREEFENLENRVNKIGQKTAPAL